MMVTTLFILTFLAVIALPLVVAYYVQRRYKPGWGLFGIGAATFIASQILHIPFNLLIQQSGFLPEDMTVFSNLLVTGLFLGASAGFFEEGARYLTYRYWAKKARSWRQGVMMGVGHGGIEAILLVGIGGLANVLIFAIWQNGGMQDIVPPEQAELFQAQVDALFSTPLYLIPLGFFERVFAMTFHVAASLLVMQVFIQNRARYWFAAFGLHTGLNATAVVVQQLALTRFGQNGSLITETILAVFALLFAWIIFKLRPSAEGDLSQSHLNSVEPVTNIEPKPLTDEKIDSSRFT